MSLGSRLLVLVLVPLLGFSCFAAILITHRVQQVAAAAVAAAQVRSAVVLDELRARVAEEAVPVVSAVRLVDLAAPGRPRTQMAVRLHSSYYAAVVRTDLALAAAQADGPAGAQARRAATRLGQVRASWGAGDTPAQREASNTRLFEKYRYLVAGLGDEVDAHLAAARAAGGGTALAAAVVDLQSVSRATTFAGEAVPLYLGLASAQPGLDTTARRDFLESWSGYRSAGEAVSHLSAPPVRAAWSHAVSETSTATVDQVLAGAVGSADTAADLTADRVLQLNADVVDRDDALHRVLAVAAAETVAATVVDAETARRELLRFSVVTAVLLALSLAGTVLVSRSITRPLAVLAGQARSLSEGQLVDVRPAGPPEARTVAVGLADAVASLRLMQAQAQAVADGHLDDDVLARPIDGPLGAVVHASVRQITATMRDREQLQLDLAHQASHDGLTGLPNRAEALAQAERALLRARRTGERVAWVFIDLDRFKAVNDSFGHAAGDAVLRTVAQRLRSCTRGIDVVARLGGDEFVVLVERVEGGSGPLGVAEGQLGLVAMGRKIIEVLSAPVPLDDVCGPGVEARVGASVGVAVSRPDCLEADRLLREADTAGYRAKAAGRGVVEVYDEELRRTLAAQAEVELGLRRAIDEGELVLFYQPVVDLVTGACRSVEALVRWDQPGRGLVPPGEFIPVAERSDLVCDLGRWALRTALDQLTAFDREGGPTAGLSVAVNVSGRHLRSEALLQDVRSALAASGVAPQRLTLEITETLIVEDPVAWGRLEALRDMGVRIAIDDFGTGYTSFAQLARCPVDVLKIDRSFVASDDPRTVELVRLVVGAARSFSLGVVAEGVEEPDQVRALRATGCATAQGYLFARPVPAARLAQAVSGCPGVLAACTEDELRFESVG